MKKGLVHIVTFLLLTICVNHFVSSQSFYEKYKELDKSNVLSLDQVDSLLSISLENMDTFSYRKIAHRYAIRLTIKGKHNDAIRYIYKEIKSFEEYDSKSETYTNALYVAGRIHYDNFEFKKAVKYYNKVIDLNNIIIRSGQAYSEMGRCYDKMGDLQKGDFYFEKGIRILINKKNFISATNQLINHFFLLNRIDDSSKYNRTNKILKKADSLSKISKISSNNQRVLLNALAIQSSAEKKYTESKSYYVKQLKSAKKDNDVQSIARVYNNLSSLYNVIRNDSSAYFVRLGLKYAESNEAIARLNDNLADYQIRKEKLDDALKSIHTSLELMTDSEIDDIPSDFQISKSLLLDYTLYCLKKKAEIYIRLYLKEFNKSHLDNALKNIERAEYVVSLLLNGTTEESTQMIWRREASQAYLCGAYVAHLLGDSEKAFSFMEKNKALLLSEGVLKNTEFANLPKHISDEETKRKKQIYRLENLLSKDEDNAILQDSLFMAKRSHERYVDSLKVDYPKYFARKINVDQIALDQVQSELNSNEAIVSFIWSDFDSDRELAIGLVATKDTSISFEVEDVEKLKEKLKTYKSFISKPFETKSDQQAFQKVAYELYELLFSTEELKRLIQGKNLMIIPDGELQNIPFESFITKENTSEYLINNGDINYAYSYSFLKHNEKVNRETTNSFVGYSPVEFTTLSLSTLKNTKEELNEINIELNGVIKLQDTATKEDFLQNTSQSQIIHLATHANAGANPWIAFSNDKLELHELYTYKNNADLVTLSACNTSLGDVAKGEGVLSLARGFFYSGSKSVVSSLWNVNDQSTSDIMTDFYKNLKEGQTKSEAINNAKRTYLSNHSLSEQSPYYWSSFILIGDTGTLEMPSNLYLYYIGIAIVFLVILIFRKKIKIFG